MIETKVRNILAANLSVPVYMEEPREPDPSYVILSKTGTFREDRIIDSTFMAKCYGPSQYEAAQLCDDLIAALDVLEADPDVGSVSINSDGDNTDTVTKRYRYQCIFVVTH